MQCFAGRNVYLTTINKKVTLFCILILEIEAFCGRTVDAILSYTVDLLLASEPFVVCVRHY